MSTAHELVFKEGDKFAAILEGVRNVARKAAEQRDAIDNAAKFPADLYDELEATGAFLLCAPKKFGGFEMSIARMNELVFEGARGLGSLGWLMMVGVAQSIGSGLFPEETVEMLFDEDGRKRTRGVIAPKGIAVPVEGGYLISGQWPFATGGPSPDFVSGNSVVMKDGKPVIGPSGHPDAILALMPASDVEFLDNWRVIGMRGTDSCDVRAKDVFVPKSRTFSLMAPSTCFDTPVARLPLRVALAFPHCALALGIGQGALDDIASLSLTKRASMNPAATLSSDPVFRFELGRQTMRLDAARALMQQRAEECWTAGEAHRELTPQEILTTRLMANHITEECVKIVDWAYTTAGSSSVYDGSSLQVRFRDIHVATQHASCHTDPYRLLGALALGEQLSPQELF
jgi:alkylation response protein AidB-like acyl-CoA dehydrogenase